MDDVYQFDRSLKEIGRAGNVVRFFYCYCNWCGDEAYERNLIRLIAWEHEHEHDCPALAA